MIQSVFNRRVIITGVLILGAACVFISRLVSLHFSNAIIMPEQPDAHNYVRRGYIKDAGGGILAMSVGVRNAAEYIVLIHPGLEQVLPLHPLEIPVPGD